MNILSAVLALFELKETLELMRTLNLTMVIVFETHYFLNLTLIFIHEMVLQAEGLIAELTLTSCYDFVEWSCDFVLKHLSVLQKLRYKSIVMVMI